MTWKGAQDEKSKDNSRARPSRDHKSRSDEHYNQQSTNTNKEDTLENMITQYIFVCEFNDLAIAKTTFFDPY